MTQDVKEQATIVDYEVIYDPCDHCNRPICYGCPHCGDTEA